MNISNSNIILNNKRSSSVEKLNSSLKALKSQPENFRFQHLKRLSTKVELNKLSSSKPRFNRKIVINSNTSSNSSFVATSIPNSKIRLEDSPTKKKFLLSTNPVTSTASKLYTKQHFETKESLFELLDRSQKLEGYLKKFRKPGRCEGENESWTQKVFNIQRVVNTTVYNTGIISRMVLHEDS